MAHPSPSSLLSFSFLDESTLHRIFSYLTFAELIPALHSCHAWHGAGPNESVRHIVLGDGAQARIDNNASMRMKDYLTTIETDLRKVRPCPSYHEDQQGWKSLLQSPIRHHIIAIENNLADRSRCQRLKHWNSVNRSLPSLTRLQLPICEYPELYDPREIPPTEWKLPPPQEVYLAPTLQDLQLFFYFLRERDMIQILETLPTAPKLHTLKLYNLLSYGGEIPPEFALISPPLRLDLTPLTHLPCLTSLDLSFKTKLTECERRVLEPLKDLKTLTHLGLNNGRLSLEDLYLLPSHLPTTILSFNLSETILPRTFLSTLHTMLPNLTSLEPFGFRIKEMNELVEFKNLTSITFYAGLVSASSDHPLTESDLLPSLVACRQLSHLHFDSCSFQTCEGWSTLFEQCIHLTSLTLGSAIPRSLSFLLHESIGRQLQCLCFEDTHLDRNEFHRLIQTDFSKRLYHCTSLTIRLDAFIGVTPQEQLVAFESSHVWSQLTSLHLEASHRRLRSNGIRPFIWKKNGQNAVRYRINNNDRERTTTTTTITEE